MASGVQSWSQTAADNATADSAVNWAEGMAPSAVNNSARAEMASVAKYRDDTAGTLTTGGTSTAYTVTSNQSFGSLSELDGNELKIKLHTTNGAAATLNVDTLGAKALHSRAGTALDSGVMLTGSVHSVTYDNSNNCFVVNSIVPIQITQQTEETIPAAADELAFFDNSAGANRKSTFANFMKVITALTAETAPAVDDELAIYDASASTADKITLANLLKVVNSLTEDTAPETSADFHLMYDSSAGAAKKVKPSSLGLPGLVLIETQAASNSATIDFTTGLNDTLYDGFELHIHSLKAASDDVQVWVRIGTGAGPTYQTSGYHYSNAFVRNATERLNGSQNASAIIISDQGTAGVMLGNASGENYSGVVRFSNPEASDFLEVSCNAAYSAAEGNHAVGYAGGRYNTAGAVTGIRVMLSSGNIASGRLSLYGVRKT